MLKDHSKRLKNKNNNIDEEQILINLGLNPDKVNLDDLSETDFIDIENRLLLDDENEEEGFDYDL